MRYAEAVKEAYSKTKSTLVEAAKQLPIEEIWLFGSAARREMRLGSDLDFLVIVGEDVNRKEVSVAIELLDVREDVGQVPVDVIVRRRSYIESGSDVFSREVLRDRKLVWRREASV